jgi:hypothetical protein
MLLDCANIPTYCQHMAVLSSSVAPSEQRMHFTYGTHQRRSTNQVTLQQLEFAVILYSHKGI